MWFGHICEQIRTMPLIFHYICTEFQKGYMSRSKKVGFYTLGCKLNFSETSTIVRQFEQGGFERAAAGEAADIYVINTCSVTETADKKCRNIIRRLAKENPDAIIAVTGCYAQLKPDIIASIEGVDIVVGNGDKGSVYDRVRNITGKGAASVHGCEAGELSNFFAAFSSGDRTRAFLKVQDGCNYHCSYCTIPLARGASRNMPVADLVREAKTIADGGQREIVITGINTGDFGRTTGESFTDLLRALDGVEGIDRYRISSIEPNLLTDEVIALCAASSKFQPHFHVPLQSGCDRILGLMRRRYTTEIFSERMAALRTAIPDVFVGIDVIVGFPGETDEDFEETYRFLERITPSFLHVFPYSVRPNTPAAGFAGKVSPDTAAHRVKRLTELSSRLHRDFCIKYLGSKRNVLFESTVKGGWMYGFTDNYIKVKVKYDKSLINNITTVNLDCIGDDEMIIGTLCAGE